MIMIERTLLLQLNRETTTTKVATTTNMGNDQLKLCHNKWDTFIAMRPVNTCSNLPPRIRDDRRKKAIRDTQRFKMDLLGTGDSSEAPDDDFFRKRTNAEILYRILCVKRLQ